MLAKKQKAKFALLSVSLLAIMFETVWGQSPVEAYESGQFELAGQLLTPNTPNHDFYLGQLRLYGYGLLKNTPLALQYFSESGKKGYLPAEQFLARYALQENNPKEALEWFKKSADKGDMNARLYCAAAYLFGYGTTKNPDAARRYYIEAAKEGSALAQFTLGQHFLERRDKQSQKLGLIWLTKAAEKGLPAAVAALEKIKDNSIESNKTQKVAETSEPTKTLAPKDAVIDWLSQGKTLTFKETPYQLTGILTEWSNASAKKDNHYNQAPSMPTLSYQALFQPSFKLIQPDHITLSEYFDSITMSQPSLSNKPENYPQYPLDPAIIVFKNLKSPVLNHPEEVELIYPNAQIPDPSENESLMVLLKLMPHHQQHRVNFQHALLELYNRAILSDASAQFELGQLYQAGVGVAKNINQAITYYELAAAQQEIRAEYNLGLLYLTSGTDAKDYAKGLEWLTDAAFKGNVYAEYVLASIYKNGLQNPMGETVVEPDLEQSLAMNYLASANDYGPAQYQLANELVKQNEPTFSLEEKRKKQALLKQLYMSAYHQGIVEAGLPLAFYLAISADPSEQKQAFELAQGDAEAGNKTAALLLGLLYDRGIGVEKNTAEAIHWYENALNHPVASFILGTYTANKAENSGKAHAFLAYASEQNLPYGSYNFAILNYLNKAPFLPTLEKAQQQGSPTAGLLLADYYLSQSQTDVAYQQAKDIYTTFAEKGDKQAALKLGYLYAKGMGTPASATLAEKWYRLAANQGNPVAQFLLGQLYQSGELGQPDYAAAEKWYHTSAESHYPQAYIALGFLSELVKHDYAAADNYYTLAAKDNHPMAWYNLGLIYEYGKGKVVDYSKAFEAYEKAAKADHPKAMAQLGHLYIAGLGTTQDIAIGSEWLEKAAKQKDASAAYQLGLLLKDKSPEKAFSYFEQAMNQGQLQAQMEVAAMLVSGTGVPKNEQRAIELYTDAAKRQVPQAESILTRLKSVTQPNVSNVPQGKTTTERNS